jgi:tryptophan halogenase
MKKREFVVVGGGTSGWITAHTLRKYFPEDNITVIYSKKLGIIGVGEASTPHAVNFLKSIGVDLGHFIKAVNGTIKHGISFENWNGDNKKYMHPFVEHLVDFSIPPLFDHSCWDHYNKLLINKKLPLDQYLYQIRIAYENKVDVKNTSFGFHFDAHKFAEYLQELAAKKNIKTIIGDVVSANLKPNGNIENLVLEDQIVDCDFVFDCSGFSKFFIGKLYQEEWISYKKYLPMNTAITFWVDPTDKLPSYTSCIAMKHGWAWKIPLQDRFGCGYVFDSNYTDEVEAKKEIEELFKQKLETRKIIKFDPGRYRNVWVKNCIAVGLSGNFIEPLESTSIWLELALLDNLKHFLNNIDDLDENSIKLFNEIVGNEVDEKMNFVYLHYMTKRSDSLFWQEFREKHPMPGRLKKIWPYFIENNLRYQQINDSMCPAQFPLMSYLWIGSGLELFDGLGNVSGYENIQPPPEIYRAIIDTAVDRALDQRQFLTSL